MPRQTNDGGNKADLESDNMDRVFVCRWLECLTLSVKISLVCFHLWYRGLHSTESIRSGVNSIKKYKCTVQVGPLFLQIHTNESTKSLYKFPLEPSNLPLQ